MEFDKKGYNKTTNTYRSYYYADKARKKEKNQEINYEGIKYTLITEIQEVNIKEKEKKEIKVYMLSKQIKKIEILEDTIN